MSTRPRPDPDRNEDICGTPNAPRWRAFSPEERQILSALLEHEPQTPAELAGRLHERTVERVKGLLANLVKRQVLKVSAAGYALDVTTGERATLSWCLAHQP